MTPCLQVERLTKSFGDLTLFRSIRFAVAREQRVGLIARNGAGKSTLLRIIAGHEPPDAGEVVWQKGLRVASLDQHPTLDPTLNVLENVFKGVGQQAQVIVSYERALIDGPQQALAQALERMDAHNAWELEQKAKQILTQLRLTQFTRPVDTLSGGEMKRIALAQALIGEPDVLILDEPTNHLDLQMVEWLEEYLLASRITLLMVTHDRYFLSRVCTHIMEIDHQEVYLYSGSYRHFLEKRMERIQARDAQAERAANRLRREVEWMRRSPPARTTKAKYRIDAFHELRAQASRRSSPGDVRIRVGAARLGSKILEVRNLTKRFDGRTVLNQFSYTFSRFERLGIVGGNGTGKSTFLNLITGAMPPDSGTLQVGETVVYGYYRQEGMAFDEQQRVIDVARGVAEVVTLADGKTLSVSQLLSLFLFPPSVQNAFVYKLSGGERRRLYLLTILMRSPNFLILDEPTNDLDIETLQVLEEYLEHFPGVVLAVSHDRHFLDRVVDGLLIFEGGGEVSGFPGSYTDYSLWAAQQRQEESRLGRQPQPKAPTRSRQPVPLRLTFAERRELQALPQEIEALAQERQELEQLISSGQLPHATLAQRSARIGEVIALIDAKEMRWLELSDREG